MQAESPDTRYSAFFSPANPVEFQPPGYSFNLTDNTKAGTVSHVGAVSVTCSWRPNDG